MRVSERGGLPRRLRPLVRGHWQREQDDDAVRGGSQQVCWRAAPGRRYRGLRTLAKDVDGFGFTLR